MTFAAALRDYIVPIGLAFALAWLLHRLAGRIIDRFVLLARFMPERLRLREERRQTLRDLFASVLSFVAFLLAFVFALGHFVDATTLVWMVGLFSAAFGLGARPLIADYLTGIGFIFENAFDIGEKVELVGVEGVVESISLRTTQLRAPTGELYTIPNGEVRVIRNFSRGRFSTANVTLLVNAADLGRALPLLEALGEEAVTLLPNLLEPWQVISKTGAVGHDAELTILAKARFGMAAEMRPRLLALVQERLAEADIPLV
ncbi:MAG: mechanosensitive ion channel family protein [Anaerolineae bacterium]|nr:mechanosensitive ion channel family protein [Anaerolineae bacterium]